MGCGSSVGVAHHPAVGTTTTTTTAAPVVTAKHAAPAPAAPAASAGQRPAGSAGMLAAPTTALLLRADTSLFEKELAGHKTAVTVAETPTIKEVAAARKKSVELPSEFSVNAQLRTITAEVCSHASDDDQLV